MYWPSFPEAPTMHTLPRTSSPGSLSFADVMSLLRILEDVVERHAEHSGDLESQLQRRRIPALFDGDDGLPGNADPFGKVGLSHFGVSEPERADPVGDPGRL